MRKLHMIAKQCDMDTEYQDMAQVLAAMLGGLLDIAKSALQDSRLATFAQALTVLKTAAASQLRQHVQDAAVVIDGSYAALVTLVREHLNAQRALLIKGLEGIGAEGMRDEDTRGFCESWSALEQAASICWAYEVGGQRGEHLTDGDVKQPYDSAQQTVIASISALKASLDAITSGLASEMVGKLGDASSLVKSLDVLCKLVKKPLDVEDALLVNMLDEAKDSVEGSLRHVAVFSGSGSVQDDSPFLGAIAQTVRHVIQAGAWVGDHNAADAHQKIVASLVGVMAEVTDILLDHAKGSAAGGTDEGLQRVLYIARQIDVLAALAHEFPNTVRAPSRGGVEAVEFVDSLIDGLAGKLEQRLKIMFPWHEQPQSVELCDAVNIDGMEADRLLTSIEALVAYGKASGKGAKYEHVDTVFKSCMRGIIVGLKAGVQERVPTVHADGTVQAAEVDRLSVALHAAMTLKADHPALYSLGMCGDFVVVVSKRCGPPSPASCSC